jgi:signal peptidase II
MNKKVLIISLIVLFIDIITKYIAYMCFQTPISIIGNVFRFNYAINTGAAWSILSNQTILINIISIVILFIIYRYSKHFKVNNRNILAFSFIYGGILGNLLNRLFTNYVIDFIDIKIFNYDYPIFNIADSAIVIGIILLIVAIIKGEDNENKGRNR